MILRGTGIAADKASAFIGVICHQIILTVPAPLPLLIVLSLSRQKSTKTVSTAEGEGESEWRGGGEVGLERGDCKSDENGGKAPKTSIFIRFAEAEPQEEMHTPQRKNSARVFPDGVRLCQMLDLNQRRHKPADLQSASFGRSDNLAYTTWCAQYPTTRLKDSLNALLGPGIDVLKRKAEQPGYGGQPPNRNRTSPGGPARRPAGGAAPQ